MIEAAIYTTIIVAALSFWLFRSPETLMVSIIGMVFWLLIFAIVFSVVSAR